MTPDVGLCAVADVIVRNNTLRLPQRKLRSFFAASVSRSYALGILGDGARTALIVCLAVEGIFLSDLLISELLPRVLEHRGSAWVLLQLLLFSAPDGLFLSLPVAILIAVYLTLLRRREAGEYIALAGMGYGGRILVAIALTAGLGFFAFSLLISTFVEPLSRFQRERVFVNMTFEGLKNAEIGAGKFYTADELTVFVTSGRLSQNAEQVFIHRVLDDGEFEAILARRTEGVHDTTGRPIGLLLDNLIVLNYGLAAAGAKTILEPASFITLNHFFFGLPDLDAPALQERLSNIGSHTTIELLYQLSREDARNIAGKRLLRGLLCLLAPMLSVLALAYTVPATLLFALPAAGAVLLAGSFFGPRFVDAISWMPAWALLGLLVAAAALFALALATLALHREIACLRPAKVNL